MRRALARIGLAALLLAALATVGPVACLRVVDPPTSAWMVQARLGALARGKSPRLAYQWVPLERIAPVMALAVVAAEDQKFPRHAGFDLDAIADALEERGAGRVRGASTISQQVAKNLFLWPERSLLRKGIEAYFTGLIELLWPKRRILEVYLNVAQFGDGVFGVGAASERFFGVPASALSARQASLLAAVLPSPGRMHADAPSQYVERRSARIRAQMRRLGSSYLAGLGE